MHQGNPEKQIEYQKRGKKKIYITNGIYKNELKIKPRNTKRISKKEVPRKPSSSLRMSDKEVSRTCFNT